MEFEDILKDVGNWGKFQKTLLFTYGASIATVMAFPGMALVLMLTVPEHHCYVPEEVYKSKDGFMNVTEDSSCRIIVESSKFVNGSTIKNTTEMNCLYGWQYNKTNFEATAATKWDMVCDNSYYPSLILTLTHVGSILGTPIYGVLADKYGRKIVCFAVLVLSAITDLVSILVSSLLAFTILRTINGSVLPTLFTLPLIHISEIVAPDKRVWVNGCLNLGWTVGMCLLPAVAYLGRSWVVLGIVSSVVSFLTLFYWKMVPESASWLVSQGRYEEALMVMTKIGEKNKCLTNKETLSLKLQELGEKIKKIKEDENRSFFKFISKFPRLRKHFFIVTFMWMSNAISYYGLIYNVVNLGGNIFLNFFLLSLVECPGYILFWIMIEKIGRRWSGSIGFFGIGLCCLLPLTGLPYTDIISSILGKLITSGIYMVPNQQACELFPTVARSMGLGTGRSIACISILFAPFLVYLGRYEKNIPFMIISLLCFTASILSSFLPETLNKNLPQTLSDAEAFGKNQKFFSYGT